jgi:hypothetical protein
MEGEWHRSCMLELLTDARRLRWQVFPFLSGYDYKVMPLSLELYYC